jgi:hypothetical protein
MTRADATPQHAGHSTPAAHPAKISRNVTGIVTVLTLVGMVTGFQSIAAGEKLASAVVPEKGAAFADATRLIIPDPVDIPNVPKPATVATPATQTVNSPASTPNATTGGSGG